MSLKVGQLARVNKDGAEHSSFAEGATVEYRGIHDGNNFGRPWLDFYGPDKETGEEIGQGLFIDQVELIDAAQPVEAPSKAYKPVHGGYPG